MKINSHISNAFPSWTKSFNKLIVTSFVRVALGSIKNVDKEVLSNIIAKEYSGEINEFFYPSVYSIKDGSWFGKLIQPGQYRLNSKMWWFATGWIQCRNQILRGNSGYFNYSQKDQKHFIGLIEVNDKTILRMRKFLYSKNIEIDELILKELHNDLVKHYLKNQNVLIGDELNGSEI